MVQIDEKEAEIILEWACAIVSEWNSLAGKAEWRLVDKLRAAFPALANIKPEDA